MPKTALICGVGGQDGSYLAKLLLQKGYRVIGTSRNPSPEGVANLSKLGIAQQVECIPMEAADSLSVTSAIAFSKPDEVYYLAGESSVANSFLHPASSFQNIALGMIYLLEAIRQTDKPIRLFNAGSSDCFGDTSGLMANELTPFKPVSPYAIAKSSAYWMVNQYRQSYGLYACTGLLFNHESPLRPAHFVTQKIVNSVKEIAAGRQSQLMLGRLDIARDWGWAPEYVEAMWLMLQQEAPDDFVIATGTTITLMEFVEAAFSRMGLDWRAHVVQNLEFMRPADLSISSANIDKIKQSLEWKPATTGIRVVERMFESI